VYQRDDSGSSSLLEIPYDTISMRISCLSRKQWHETPHDDKKPEDVQNSDAHVLPSRSFVILCFRISIIALLSFQFHKASSNLLMMVVRMGVFPGLGGRAEGCS
jgi:hypothetical protein